ncbi:MAG: lytic murein transglycosylase B [Pseudomonadota bacterium]
MIQKTLILFALAMIAISPSFAYDTKRQDVADFIQDVSKRNELDPKQLTMWLEQAEKKQNILDAISRPAEGKPWHEYRKIFITERRINAGVTFWEENAEDIRRISQQTGVADKTIVAIIGVESFFGRITGSFRVIDALATLAFDYPKRSKFFTKELEQFFLLIDEEAIDPLEATGSYAGAMGSPQFISSSYRAYAVDGNGDNKRDLWSSWPDIIASVANYFKVHRWRNAAPVAVPAQVSTRAGQYLAENKLTPKHTVGELRRNGVVFETELPDDAKAMLIELEAVDGPEYWVCFHNFSVITKYNRSILYAMAVHQLGDLIEQQRAQSLSSR